MFFKCFLVICFVVYNYFFFYFQFIFLQKGSRQFEVAEEKKAAAFFKFKEAVFFLFRYYKYKIIIFLSIILLKELFKEFFCSKFSVSWFLLRTVEITGSGS